MAIIETIKQLGTKTMPASTPLAWPEIVRKKPGMFIGGTDERALAGCVSELIANSMEEYLAGRGLSITVSVHADGSLSVKDDGGGISVDPDPQEKIPQIERLLTTLHFPRDDTKRPYRVLGLCGVGTKCVNAVSEWMQINTVWEGVEYQLGFARGLVNDPLTKISQNTATRGTLIRFKPDGEIFRTTNFDRNRLAVQLNHLAILHPGLEFWLVDERPNSANRPIVMLFHYPGGIAEYLRLNSPPEWITHTEPISLCKDEGGMKIETGFQFTESASVSLPSFTNSSPTQREGTHVQGLLKGLADAVNELARPKEPFLPIDIRTSLNAIIGVWLTEPHYGGSTKDELINDEVEAAARQMAADGLRAWAAGSGRRFGWLVESLDARRHGTGDTN